MADKEMKEGDAAIIVLALAKLAFDTIKEKGGFEGATLTPEKVATFQQAIEAHERWVYFQRVTNHMEFEHF